MASLFSSKSILIVGLLWPNFGSAIFEVQTPLSSNPMVVTSDSLPVVVTPGGHFTLNIKLSLAKDYKTYRDKFKLKLNNSSQFEIKNFEITPTIKFYDPISKVERVGFVGEGELKVEIKTPKNIPAGRHSLLLQFEYEVSTPKLYLFSDLVFLSLNIDIQSLSPERVIASKTPPEKTVPIKFVPYSDAELKKAIANNTPIIIDFWAKWCEPCILLDKKTYANPEVAKISQQFLVLQVDATEPDPLSERLKKLYDVQSLPAVIFFDKKGNWVKELTLRGFEDALKFINRMKILL